MQINPSNTMTKEEWEAGNQAVKAHFEKQKEALNKIIEETRGVMSNVKPLISNEDRAKAIEQVKALKDK